MAKRPIYRAEIRFNYYITTSIRPKIKTASAEIFITTEDIAELNQDPIVVSRLLKKVSKNKNVKVDIQKVNIINQFGYTNDRF